MTPIEFRNALSQLYANAHGAQLFAEDLALAAEVSRHTMVKWIGGYACPGTPQERSAVIDKVAAFVLRRALHSYIPDRFGRCLTCGEPGEHRNHQESWI